MIPIFSRVLVIGINSATSKLVCELARFNPNVHFDYVTTFDVDNLTLPNVKVLYMDLYLNARSIAIHKDILKNIEKSMFDNSYVGFYSWLKNHLDKNINSYDFVITNVVQLQSLDWIHSYSESVPLFCPDKICYTLENDKLFTKQMLIDIGIPTPKAKTLDRQQIKTITQDTGYPMVLKTNKIETSGAGTVVIQDESESSQITHLLEVAAKTAPVSTVYTEEFISGREVSVHFLCNGASWQYMGAARDYKKMYDADTGPNTAGIGCYSPVEYFTDDIRQVVSDYMSKIMRYLNNIGIYYKGIMYLGIIIDDNNVPHILEINTRGGSPELITILDTIDNQNLLENLYRAATGMDLLEITQKLNTSAVSVGIINKNHTIKCRLEANRPLMDLTTLSDIELHMHCMILNHQNYFGFLSSQAPTRVDASEKIYNYLKNIDMRDYRYRTDIGNLE